MVMRLTPPKPKPDLYKKVPGKKVTPEEKLTKSQMQKPAKTERRAVDERGVVRRGLGGPAKVVASKRPVDREKPGRPLGPITERKLDRNEQKGYGSMVKKVLPGKPSELTKKTPSFLRKTKPVTRRGGR